MKLQFRDFCKDKSHIHLADLVLEEYLHTGGHSHDFYEFLVVLEGEFIHDFAGQRVVITKGTCQFIKPETFHRLYKSPSAKRSRLRNIAVEKVYFESLMARVGKQVEMNLWEPFVLGSNGLEQFQYKTDKIMRFYNAHMASYIVESIVMDLVVSYLYEREQIGEGPKWLKEACRAFEQVEQLSQGLPRLLSLCGKTQEHVNRAFQKYYEMTPTAYINDLRLNWSCQFLVTTNEPIIQIAYTCGFNTVAYYNRLFKQRYGCTPSQYRERNHKTFC